MREYHYIDLDHPIPLYVAAFGPKAQALAGELGDGLVSGLPRGGTIPNMLDNVRRGAEKTGRQLGPNFYTAAMVNIALQQPGESLTSDRIVETCGAAAITGLHYLVARYLEAGEDPPDYAKPIWKGYMDWLNAAPPEIRHQRLHHSHYSFVDPEEARFITPELIQASCVAGAPEEVVEQLRRLEQQGLKQAMLYPPLNRNYRVIEDFADQVMAKM
jgi:alkanesulfonate monooxygenase SsuD/methylene tetrahydromethanopterin reductase-like flavin-dependent oxidoreductase (luciferase family)